ncbi:hypothetical protein AMATHDRAFT_77225 [Amanita thiersii Skay4041]|uniref:Terpene synthase n=1 Tax=Amanita thiersii Skay4041 TaxID=703135 RepID=A0A2A9NI94_9AGAR|nr:hypothetical protein AMATHDRAFT_77225 [Amanita thiersii Skay4041]
MSPKFPSRDEGGVRSIILPDLVTQCNLGSPQLNRHRKQVTRESEQWFLHVHIITKIVLDALNDPYTVKTSLRLEQMTRDSDKHMLQTARTGVQKRVDQQTRDRAAGRVPSLDTYISLRRDTSGCKTCWALIEYANNLKIPDEIIEHPIIKALNDAATDFVGWSNDLYSYNKERCTNDSHNMVIIVMTQKGLGVQAAIDFVGDLCKQAADSFIRTKTELPSWGLQIDREVGIYVDGMESWMVGVMHWSLQCVRYFGSQVKEVQLTRRVQL